MAFIPKQDYLLYKRRREDILAFIKREYPELKNGMIILFSDFENDRYIFRQESSFYYLTGIMEPGAVFCSFLDGREFLYLPNYGGLREKWVKSSLDLNDSKSSFAQTVLVDQVKYLGQACGTFSFNPIFSNEKYSNLLIDIESFLQENKKNHDQIQVFTLLDNMSNRYFMQFQIYKNILEIFPKIEGMTRDLAPLIHHMRRFKSEYEIDLIYKATQVTCMAQETAAGVIGEGKVEHEVQAVIESIFTQLGVLRPAFPTIVATGKNSTVLHYTNKDKKLDKGELVVVDIGAEYGYYASDLTRTYPVDGKFTEKQLEYYNAVLKAQAYIESIAKPGYYLNNADNPDISLNHLALKYFKEIGLDKYVAHGIGHFLGLDVHDVGDNSFPLAAGDVFTIEPGIYIPELNMGIRIEDIYLMTDEGVVCLSYQLPRSAKEIESLMNQENDFFE